eukprot:6309304-Pyramimonas_sp.AAC.1
MPRAHTRTHTHKNTHTHTHSKENTFCVAGWAESLRWRKDTHTNTHVLGVAASRAAAKRRKSAETELRASAAGPQKTGHGSWTHLEFGETTLLHMGPGRIEPEHP